MSLRDNNGKALHWFFVPKMFIFLALFSCASAKHTLEEIHATSFVGCPEAGTCELERIPYSKVSLEEDTVGQWYSKIETSEEFHLYKITYQRTVDERLMDAQYQEVVYFQLPVNTKSIAMKDEALSQVQLIYGRFCYCPGKTGFQRITKGSLAWETKKKSTHLVLHMEEQEIPIKLNAIEVTMEHSSN